MGDKVIFSDRILNDEGSLTLDDQTLSDISKTLKVPLEVTGDSPEQLFNTIRG